MGKRSVLSIITAGNTPYDLPVSAVVNPNATEALQQNVFMTSKTPDLLRKLRKSGILATVLQITIRKVLYTFGRLLLRFNVTIDKCHLNSGF
jgi:hypothetical protein